MSSQQWKEYFDWQKYAGKYIKITQDHLDCYCFCSLVNCLKKTDFELGEVVVETHSNLYHVKCYYTTKRIYVPNGMY